VLFALNKRLSVTGNLFVFIIIFFGNFQ
jgi:hypothetical protein